MSSAYILDTSIFIDFLRREDKSDTYLYKLSQENVGLNISIVTHAELFAGKSVWENDNAESELEDLLGGLNILGLNEKVSKNAGKIRAKYNTGMIDAIIAATSISHEMALVTLNIKHFKGIKGLKLVS